MGGRGKDGPVGCECENCGRGMGVGGCKTAGWEEGRGGEREGGVGEECGTGGESLLRQFSMSFSMSFIISLISSWVLFFSVSVLITRSFTQFMHLY